MKRLGPILGLLATLGIMVALLQISGGTRNLSADNEAPVPVMELAGGQAFDAGQLPTTDVEAAAIYLPTEAGEAAERPTPTTSAPVVSGPSQGISANDLQAPIIASPTQPTDEESPSIDWNPPSFEVPLARQANDHYWFIRPVAANYRNSGLPYYPYGSDGAGNNLRIHHGIDLSNPIGVEIQAAADGLVIWAEKGHFNQYEGITSYGNTVVIQHDLGYKGQPVYTLYAHMASILVEEQQRVSSGDVIGLIGNTGQVSGPHVHVEVRLGENRYSAVRNPDLWIAPYLGTGVVAGRLEMPSGIEILDAEIILISQQTGYITHRTTTYAGSSVNPDDHWQENFVIPDVPEGRYLAQASFSTLSWEVDLTVQAGMTNWVELQLVQEP